MLRGVPTHANLGNLTTYAQTYHNCLENVRGLQLGTDIMQLHRPPPPPMYAIRCIPWPQHTLEKPGEFCLYLMVNVQLASDAFPDVE